MNDMWYFDYVINTLGDDCNFPNVFSGNGQCRQYDRTGLSGTWYSNLAYVIMTLLATAATHTQRLMEHLSPAKYLR